MLFLCTYILSFILIVFCVYNTRIYPWHYWPSEIFIIILLNCLICIPFISLLFDRFYLFVCIASLVWMKWVTWHDGWMDGRMHRKYCNNTPIPHRKIGILSVCPRLVFIGTIWIMDNTLYNYSYLSPKLTENEQQSKIVSKKKREKFCKCTNVCLSFGWQVTVFGIVDSYDLTVRINS